MNRDEAINRPESDIFEVMTSSSILQYWWPVDGQSNGTWFGARGDGVVAALLNRYQDKSASAHTIRTIENVSPAVSRGHVIPYLLKQATTALPDAVSGPEFEHFCQRGRLQAFDLVLLLSDSIVQCSWTGEKRLTLHHNKNRNFFLTSSSVDVEACQRYRSRQFSLFELQATSLTPERIITDLHNKSCPENPSLGFLMSRPGRATRSISQVITKPGGVVSHQHMPLSQ